MTDDWSYIAEIAVAESVLNLTRLGADQRSPEDGIHDDGEALPVILFDTCGNLCADCDRFLCLHRKTRHHARQVFKEEEAIKVNHHEVCGRTKLFWLTEAADSSTLKGMIEFMEVSSVQELNLKRHENWF